jgi:hypothetical protein
MDSARTFVVARDTRVVGYISLTMGSALRADAPIKLVRGLPVYPVGMVRLARLAADHRDKGEGLGALLLAEAGFVAGPEHPLRLYRRMEDVRASIERE